MFVPMLCLLRLADHALRVARAVAERQRGAATAAAAAAAHETALVEEVLGREVGQIDRVHPAQDFRQFRAHRRRVQRGLARFFAAQAAFFAHHALEPAFGFHEAARASLIRINSADDSRSESTDEAEASTVENLAAPTQDSSEVQAEVQELTRTVEELKRKVEQLERAISTNPKKHEVDAFESKAEVAAKPAPAQPSRANSIKNRMSMFENK